MNTLYWPKLEGLMVRELFVFCLCSYWFEVHGSLLEKSDKSQISTNQSGFNKFRIRIWWQLLGHLFMLPWRLHYQIWSNPTNTIMKKHITVWVLNCYQFITKQVFSTFRFDYRVFSHKYLKNDWKTASFHSLVESFKTVIKSVRCYTCNLIPQWCHSVLTHLEGTLLSLYSKASQSKPLENNNNKISCSLIIITVTSLIFKIRVSWVIIQLFIFS